MKFFSAILLVGLLAAPSAQAGVGISGGVGIPFLAQFGVDYKASSDWSFYVGYNLLDLDVGSAAVELSMPEVLARYHPFSQAFYIGFGLGQESLDASAVDATTGLTARAEVTAITGIAKLGWMWGAADNDGLWFGVDVAYIMPFGADTTITAPGIPTTDPDYQDVVEAAEEFGETAYFNFTFARLGFIF